jgi:hypothetical protein
MKKTVLIPTDFSIESLNLVKYAAQAAVSEPVNVLLVHGVRQSDSIMDLLFFSRNKTILKLQNADFDEACKVLRNKYDSRINSFRIEIFSGFTQSAFQKFLEAHRVNEILIPKSYILKLTSDRSFDLLPFIKTSPCEVTEVAWRPFENAPEKNLLAEVFLL